MKCFSSSVNRTIAYWMYVYIYYECLLDVQLYLLPLKFIALANFSSIINTRLIL